MVMACSINATACWSEESPVCSSAPTCFKLICAWVFRAISDWVFRMEGTADGSSDACPTRRPELNCRWTVFMADWIWSRFVRNCSLGPLTAGSIAIPPLLRNHLNGCFRNIIQSGQQAGSGFIAFLKTEQGHRLVVQRNAGNLVAKGAGLGYNLLLGLLVGTGRGALLADIGRNPAEKIRESEAVHAAGGGRAGQGCQLVGVAVGVSLGVDRGQLIGRDGRVQSETAGRRRGVGIVVDKQRGALSGAGIRRNRPGLQNAV